MNDSNDEGLDAEYGFAEDEEVVMSFLVGLVLAGRFVRGVNVDMWPATVVVLMEMQFSANDVPSSADAKVDEHNADAEFKVRSDRFITIKRGVFG